MLQMDGREGRPLRQRAERQGDSRRTVVAWLTQREESGDRNGREICTCVM